VEAHHGSATGITRVPDAHHPLAPTYLYLAHLTIVMPSPPQINATAARAHLLRPAGITARNKKPEA